MAVKSPQIDVFLENFYSRVRVVPSRYKELKELVSSFQDIDWSSLPDNPRSTPDQIIQLIEKFKGNSSGHNALAKITNFNAIPSLNSYVHAKDDCYAILEESGVFNFRSSDEIDTKVSDVKMYDPNTDIEFNFGDFKVIMTKNEAYCVPEGNNTMNADGFYHPYLGKGDHKLCFGEYQTGYQESMKQGRFYDAYSTIKTVMSFYGGDEANGQESGPHMALFNWAGQRCAICDSVFKPEEGGFSCSKSGEPICPVCGKDHDNIDTVTKMVFMPQFLSKCEVEGCDANTTNVRNGKCTKCRLLEKASAV